MRERVDCVGDDAEEAKFEKVKLRPSWELLLGEYESFLEVRGLRPEEEWSSELLLLTLFIKY